ncbi:MAG: nucleotidyltransferase [Deltaproteobacteria bacterium]|nr:nucleotidyltransferase [Deltaproteobacteria bacterium]
MLDEIVAAASLLLEACDVDHCLIGGLAVAIHGYVRATYDVDFLISELDLEKVLERAPRYGFVFDEGDRELACEGIVFLRYGEINGPRVDFLVAEAEIEQEIISGAHEEVFDAHRLPVARVEDLIAMKLAAGRPQDELDAERLIERRSPDFAVERYLAVAAGLGCTAKARAWLKEE